MKRLIIAAILLIASSKVLPAQTTKTYSGAPGTNQNNPGYVDANKNNVCDNYENNTRAFTNKGQMQGRRVGKVFSNRQCRLTIPCNGTRIGRRR